MTVCECGNCEQCRNAMILTFSDWASLEGYIRALHERGVRAPMCEAPWVLICNRFGSVWEVWLGPDDQVWAAALDRERRASRPARGGDRMSTKDETDTLGTFLAFADAVQASAERAHRPAYAETCTCGGSVEVGRDVSRADLRRIHANFLGRHRDCGMALTLDLAPVIGVFSGEGS
jgi:hypothetical protein